MRFGLTDDQFLRFAASRALARADMGLYKFYYTVAGGSTAIAPTARSPGPFRAIAPAARWPGRRVTPADTGNPALKPTTADQVDLTYEWYFSARVRSRRRCSTRSSTTTSVKASLRRRNFTNNGVTRTVNVTRPDQCRRCEGQRASKWRTRRSSIALPEPWNGLGVQANFTYVDNKGVSNSGLTTVSGDGSTQPGRADHLHGPAARGLLDKSYNLVLMYEKQKFSARLAYNWRDEYLISQADCCIKLPIWQDAYGQLDAFGPLQAERELGHLPRCAEPDRRGDGAAAAGQR